MKTLLATLLLCLSAFGQQIDLTKNVKSILPRKNGGLGVGAINSYGGSISSASSIAVACNQSLTVTGSTTIQTITMSPSVGCAAILIAGSGATWSTGTSGNISVAITPTVGYATLLVSDGSKFNPGVGASGTNGTGVLSGTGVPSSGLGVNGDFYIDTAGPTIYGPKSAGVWGSGTSLVGPAGPSGVTVTLGPLQFLQGMPDQLTPTQQAANLPYYLTSDYNFAAQTPGGTLTGASPATVTMAPCPLGVNGADASHYYWLSAGTGTAEAVLGTGGTCTPNAASGTIVFTPANNHSGAWTIGSASSGAREAILASGGNAVIRLPASATLLIAGGGGLVIDQHNLTIVGAGYGSVIQARANQSLDALINVTDGDGLRLLNFTIDGNRGNAGTKPSGATAIGCGLDGTGGCSHVAMQWLQIFHSTQTAIGIHDANVDILIQNCWIHDNGGVLNTSGAGQGIFSYRASEIQTATTGLTISHNYISHNHNTLTNAGPSAAIAVQGQVTITDNYIDSNYNNGGQVVISHSSSGPAIITSNVITMSTTALSQATSGIESDAGGGVVISGNTITEHLQGAAIALEGGAAGGASNTIISANLLQDASAGITLNNAGGITRGTVITGNRINVGGGSTGIYVDTATASTTVTGNDFSDTGTPITDNSVDGIYLYGNFPLSANLVYAGTLASSNGINIRCGQAATVTGAATIHFLVQPDETAGGNGAGCAVSLIPAAGSTWTTATGGNIGLGSTATPGQVINLISDGSLFWPNGSGTAGGTLGVANGGTGATTLTGILEGHGTSPVTGNAASSQLTYLRRKPNVTGTSYEFAALSLAAADYNFPAQTPGGSISIGSNTITLTPCPLGVAGGDVNHYYYLSAGTGTAEAVLSTGGTCTSGAASGTAIVTAANTHSGAWTIQSATAGIKEAMNVLPATGGKVYLAKGVSNIYATVFVGNGTATTQSTISGIGLIGEGAGAGSGISTVAVGGSSLKWGGASGGTVVKVMGPIGQVLLEDFQIDANAGAADVGLDIVHSYLSTYSRISINGWNSIGLRSQAVDFSFPNMVTGNNNNDFISVLVDGLGYGSASSIGGIFGQATQNVHAIFDFASNNLINCSFLSPGLGVDLRLADNNTFTNVVMYGTVNALRFNNPVGSDAPFANTFIHSPMISNVLANPTTFTTTYKNSFLPFASEGPQDPMPLQGFMEGFTDSGKWFGRMQQVPLYYTSSTAPAAITNTTSPTAFAHSYSIPAGAMDLKGALLRVHASGQYSTTGTPALTLVVKLGTLPIATFVCATANGASGAGWFLISEAVVETGGAGGDWNVGAAMASVAGGSGTPFTSSTLGTQAMDFTAAKTLTVEVTWGAASASNTIQMDSLTAEIMFPSTAQ